MLDGLRPAGAFGAAGGASMFKPAAGVFRPAPAAPVAEVRGSKRGWWAASATLGGGQQQPRQHRGFGEWRRPRHFGHGGVPPVGKAALGDAGVDKVFCVASAAEPVQALAWGASVLEKAEASGKIETLADRDGSFARMLGVDAPAGSPVPTHRYACLVEDGILLKLKVEADPAKCDNTRGDVMLQCAKEFFHD